MKRKPKPKTWWAIFFDQEKEFYPIGHPPILYYTQQHAQETIDNATYDDDWSDAKLVCIKLIKVKPCRRKRRSR